MSDISGESRSDSLALRIAELEAENRRLRDLLGIRDEARSALVDTFKPTLFVAQGPSSASSLTQRSSPGEKAELFRSLFRGRDDVYALRWDNARTGKSGWGPAVKGGWANTHWT